MSKPVKNGSEASIPSATFSSRDFGMALALIAFGTLIGSIVGTVHASGAQPAEQSAVPGTCFEEWPPRAK